MNTVVGPAGLTYDEERARARVAKDFGPQLAAKATPAFLESMVLATNVVPTSLLLGAGTVMTSVASFTSFNPLMAVAAGFAPALSRLRRPRTGAPLWQGTEAGPAIDVSLTVAPSNKTVRIRDEIRTLADPRDPRPPPSEEERWALSDALSEAATSDLAPIASLLGDHTVGPSEFRAQIGWLNQTVRALVPLSTLSELAADDRIVSVGLPRAYELEATVAIPATGAPTLRQSTGLDGSGVTVAVIDGEVDTSHALLRGKVERAERFTSDEPWGRPHPHATAVAALIVSVAPGVTIRNYKVWDTSRPGPQYPLVGQALSRAVDDHAKVLNCSFGTKVAGRGDPHDDAACVEAWDNGVTVVKSAGNNGRLTAPCPPGRAVVVGATNRTNSAVWDRSGRGTYGGRTGPDLVAPGGTPGDRITVAGSPPLYGTSLSAAILTGVCALLLQRNPEWRPADLARALTSRCVPLSGRGDEEGAGALRLA